MSPSRTVAPFSSSTRQASVYEDTVSRSNRISWRLHFTMSAAKHDPICGGGREVDEACEIDSVKVLAERYLIEIEDPLNNRSILDHLIRSSN